MFRKPHVALLMLFGLCACEAPSKAESPGERPAETEARTSAPESGWKLSSNTDGVSLDLVRNGEPVARFACLTAGRVFQARGFGLNPIASEERLTVGAGDEAHDLVADPGAPVAGVQGSGAISPALLQAIEAGGRLSVSYGAQTLGPLESLSPRDRTVFVSGCRAALAS